MINEIYQKKEKLKNKNNIFKFISLKKEFSKQDVVNSLNLSFPTVTKFVDEFLKNEIIQEKGHEEGKNGRKSLIYRYNPDSYFSVGVKLEIDSISFLLINLDGKEIKKSEIKKDFVNKSDLVEYIFSQLERFLKDFEKEKKIKGIGISLPGIVNDETKIFEIGTNLKLYSKEFKAIENRMNLPVFLSNEANAGAIGEYILGNLDNQNLAYISINTGIGCGIILKGKLYSGTSFSAGELGHFTVENRGRECLCGNKGCLERYCSNTALIKDFEEKFQISSLDIFEIFSKNLHLDPKGEEILERYIEFLANSVRTLQLLLDLDKVIIGGEISYYKNYFNLEEKIKDLVFNNIFLKNRKILEFSKHSNSSNLLGAAFLPFEEFYFNNNRNEE